MNKEFVDALNMLAAERNLDKDQLLGSLEEALEQAFERNVMPGKQIEVTLDPDSGEMEVLVIRRVVEEVEDEDKEISLTEALDLDDSVEVGMEMEFPTDPERFTRIAVQTTKQVITQKIREAERAIVFEEYKDRAGDIITGVVSRTDNKRNVFVDLGRGEAIMPPREQIHGERYMVGMRVKVYVEKVELSTRGPSILVSRAAPQLLEYLMRQEIPEVADGTVEIKAVAREAGQRSKVAVASTNPNVDPIGACIGHRGSRIQAVTAELQRERVDIIMWDPNPREFIRNALSPAKVGTIELDTEEGQARVTVGSDQLSLAIGKGGQNVRLAAKLTGFKIDLVGSETVSDLDAAMQAAASRMEDVGASDHGHAAFDALFSASPEPQPEAPASDDGAPEAPVEETAEQAAEDAAEVPAPEQAAAAEDEAAAAPEGATQDEGEEERIS
ncbi:MAG TPA: transcription termination factor NusA [Trueperaceae bacterium]|nr:transcription termination factor NusA [Trueperaceae bacterium]